MIGKPDSASQEKKDDLRLFRKKYRSEWSSLYIIDDCKKKSATLNEAFYFLQ